MIKHPGALLSMPPLFMFDKAICINLEHRIDRWEAAQLQFEKFGIDVERFNAVAHENPMTGIHISYQEIFRANRGKSLLILEDDVEFIRSFGALKDAYGDLPEDWDMLYLGGNAQNKQHRFSTWLFKANGILSTHAILYSAKMVDWLADNMFEAHDKIDRSNTLDVWFMKEVQPRFNCFIVYPQIASQAFGYSDICKMNINYKWFNKQSQKFYS